MIFAATSFKYVFDYQPEDVYWCTADIGWITGHSYLTYGPLANGATSVLVSAVCQRVLFLQEKGHGGAELHPLMLCRALSRMVLLSREHTVVGVEVCVWLLAG